MKINLNNIDRTQFMVSPHEIAGEVCYLVQPQHIGCKWTQNNKHLRSSLYNSNGELISAGFPKFTNWGENPENFPLPKSLTGCQAVTKIDGSLLIVSFYKGNLIARTRGTVDATKLETGAEIEILKQKYPYVFNKDKHNRISYLFEWVGKQKIVINYGDEPDLYLIGMIYHEDYSLYTQDYVDSAADIMGVKRPSYFEFNSIPEMIESVKKMEGMEGIVLYSNDGQTLHKIKGEKYLLLHSLKSELSSFEKVIDLWNSIGRPNYTDYYNYICNQFDFELGQQAMPLISKLLDAWEEVQAIIFSMEEFAASVKHLSRKDAALKILASYGQTNRSGMVFKCLDGRLLNSDDDSIKKLLFQVTKSV